MNSEQVNELYKKYANVEEKSDTKPQEVDTSANVETPKEVVKEEPTTTGIVDSDAQTQNPDTVKDETSTKPVDVETKIEKKPTYTRQEKIDYAFQKKQARIKKLMEENRSLKEELTKFKGLTLDNFGGNTQDYLDYQIDMKDKERHSKFIEDQIREAQAEEYDRRNNEKISNCFPDEVEQERFNSIVKTEGPKLLKTLDAYDKDGAVLSFLDDSDISPLLIRILVSEPSYLKQVLSKHTSMGKFREMEKLEEKVLYAKAQLANRNKAVPEKSEDTKPALPVIGSVTKSEAHKDSKTVFDPNAILHKLKQKNKYHK